MPCQYMYPYVMKMGTCSENIMPSKLIKLAALNSLSIMRNSNSKFLIIPTVAGFLCVISIFSCRKDPVSLHIWREQTIPVVMDINSVWFADSLRGFAAGGISWKSGCILSTLDGGNTWLTDSITGYSLECVMADSSGRAYAVGQAGRGFERPPDKTGWYLFREDYRWHRACFMRNGQQSVIVSGESFDGGELRTLGPEYFWVLDTTQLFPNQLQAVWSTTEKTWHACGMGWVLRSDDGGYTWTRLENTGDFFTAIHFPSQKIGYICGRNGTILKTTDEGQSWQEIRKGGAVKPRYQRFKSIWFSSATEGWVVGEAGLFWHTEDGGDSWSRVKEVPSEVNFTDVFVLDGRGWASGEGGRMFYFEY